MQDLVYEMDGSDGYEITAIGSCHDEKTTFAVILQESKIVVGLYDAEPYEKLRIETLTDLNPDDVNPGILEVCRKLGVENVQPSWILGVEYSQ